ncbi:MAG: hypothetical protein QNL04_11390 [SAR324 cluster bacterium]|nr:hypothetical protein [SAR324 cluster bacterium]
MKKIILWTSFFVLPNLAFAHEGHTDFNAFHIHGIVELVTISFVALAAFLYFKQR